MPLDVEAIRTEVLQPHLTVSHRFLFLWLTGKLPPVGAIDAHEPKIPSRRSARNINGPVSPRGVATYLAVHHISCARGLSGANCGYYLSFRAARPLLLRAPKIGAAAGRLYSLFAAPTRRS